MSLLRLRRARPQPPAGENAYFDLLASQSEVVYTMAIRTDAEIDLHLFGDPGEENEPFYDSSLDACIWPFPIDSSLSGSTGSQLRISENQRITPALVDGKVLYAWDCRWDENWGTWANRGNNTSNKSFQMANRVDGGDNRRFEIQSRYGNGTAEISLTEPEVGHFTLRTYGLDGMTAKQGILQIPMTNDFIIHRSRWIRHWFEIDIDGGGLVNWWAGDSVQGVLQLLTNYDSDFAGKLDDFWWEWNTSQPRTTGGPAMPLWGRNLVVLHNANAASLVSQNSW